MFLKKIFTLSNLTLVTALVLSGIAAWYSILGLIAIFAAAVIPIIVMGGALEVAKVVTTVWLHRYWHKAGWVLKMYLVPAVIALAFLTSMGIFGFLSKAHMDQGIVSGDSQAKLSLIDEKIKTQRDNIELARKALVQMDNQVDARLSRGDSEQGAERAVQIRRQQAGERTKLQKEIGDAQKVIAQLNEERAPIAAENRKIEAEVGPIKYIAALIYGDNPDANLLERAVRWVIILIVFVFDPLALTLVIASSSSRQWEFNTKKTEEKVENNVEEPIIEKENPVLDHPLIAPLPEHDIVEKIVSEIKETKTEEQPIIDKPLQEEHPYLFKKWISKIPGIEKVKPQVFVPEKEPEEKVIAHNDVPKMEVLIKPETVISEEPAKTEEKPVGEIKTEGVTKEKPYKEVEGGYVVYEGKAIQKEAFSSLHPNLMLTADSENQINTNFGIQFPRLANRGDVFVRVDILPNKVFKFDGDKWIEINKDTSDSYLYDEEYIKYLVEQIDKGQYDVELLSDNERSLIEQYLKNKI